MFEPLRFYCILNDNDISPCYVSCFLCYYLTEREKLMGTVAELQSQMGETSSETEEMKERLIKQENQLQQLDSIYEENKLLQQKCIELDDSRISKF